MRVYFAIYHILALLYFKLYIILLSYHTLFNNLSNCRYPPWRILLPPPLMSSLAHDLLYTGTFEVKSCVPLLNESLRAIIQVYHLYFNSSIRLTWNRSDVYSFDVGLRQWHWARVHPWLISCRHKGEHKIKFYYKPLRFRVPGYHSNI